MRRNAKISAGVLISAALLTAAGCNKAAKDTDPSCPASCPAGSSATCPAGANRPACRPVGNPQCPAVSTTAAAAGRLDSETEAALLAAVADERLAQAYYQAVMDRYGQHPPFSRVINAERHHEAMLLDLCTRYGVQVPAGVDSAVAIPDSFRASCARAVELERSNARMYERFLGFVDEPDIRGVMTALHDASVERHLPAFERNS